MAKVQLRDLNEHLFAQLERLSEDNASEELIEKEVKRAREIANIADKILTIGKLELEAEKLRTLGDIQIVPKIIDVKRPLDVLEVKNDA